MPLLLKRGSHPVYVGAPLGNVYGDFGSSIDRIAIVRYRSLYDLVDMIADPAMSAGSRQKFAGLSKTDVIATRPIMLALSIRLTAALLLVVVGFALHFVLRAVLP